MKLTMDHYYLFYMRDRIVIVGRVKNVDSNAIALDQCIFVSNTEEVKRILETDIGDSMDTLLAEIVRESEGVESPLDAMLVLNGNHILFTRNLGLSS